MPKPPVRLVPARPHPEDESQAHLPRMPWRWIIVGTFALCTIVGGYWIKEKQKADALRAQILRVHTYELADVSKQYQSLRDKLERWILKAASSKPDNYVHPRLNIPGLRKGRGLYVRIRTKFAKSKDKISDGVLEPGGDGITPCLGLEPGALRTLYEKGEFLTPEWIAEARTTGRVMRLRVIDEELALRIRRDLPEVQKLLFPQWFLLVLQHGKTRRDAPVDVFLWDMRSSKSLLRARITADGSLVPVRYLSKGMVSPNWMPPKVLQETGGADCSIAAQIKALAGAEMVTFGSQLAAPESDGVEPVSKAPGAGPDRPPAGAGQDVDSPARPGAAKATPTQAGPGQPAMTAEMSASNPEQPETAAKTSAPSAGQRQPEASQTAAQPQQPTPLASAERPAQPSGEAPQTLKAKGQPQQVAPKPPGSH